MPPGPFDGAEVVCGLLSGPSSAWTPLVSGKGLEHKGMRGKSMMMTRVPVNVTHWVVTLLMTIAMLNGWTSEIAAQEPLDSAPGWLGTPASTR